MPPSRHRLFRKLNPPSIAVFCVNVVRMLAARTRWGDAVQIKKNQLFWALGIVFCLVLGLAYPAITQTWSGRATPLAGRRVVIDAGHGGPDAGCTGGSVTESQLTVAFALKIGTVLELAGCDVTYTRTDNNGLGEPPWSKQKDMRQRRYIIEQANPDVVLSIHMNTFATPQSGVQIFYQQDHEASPPLADALRNAFAARRVNKSGDFYVLRHSKAAGVIIECGFLNNPAEEVLLCDPAWQDAFALTVCTGLSQYFVTLGVAASAMPTPMPGTTSASVQSVTPTQMPNSAPSQLPRATVSQKPLAMPPQLPQVSPSPTPIATPARRSQEILQGCALHVRRLPPRL